MKYIVGFLSGVLFLGVIIAVAYGISNYRIMPKESSQMANTKPLTTPVTTEPTKGEMIATSASPSPVATSPSMMPQQNTKVISVSGALGYPSSFVPAMKICLYEYADPGMIQGPKYCTFTKDNQGSFKISGDISPSKYVVFAWPANAAAGSELAGSFTPAVACGLSVDCKDHAPIPLDVVNVKTVTNVDIRDWYADAGTFPTKPAEDGVLM